MNIPLVDPGELPDLGLRAKAAFLVKLRVRQLVTDVLADRLFHAEIVAAGVGSWRRGFMNEFGAEFVANRKFCDDLADSLYRAFERVWYERYRAPDSPAYDNLSASAFLDRVEQKSPPTEEEIEDAWRLEIGSSESAVQQMYEGSARSRKGADIFRFNRKKG